MKKWQQVLLLAAVALLCLALAAGQGQNFPGGGGGGDGGVNAQSVPYTATAADAGKLITQAVGGNNITLPNPVPSATWFATIKALGGDIAIVPNGLTLDGSGANYVIGTNDAVTVYSNGTNYVTGGQGASGGSALTNSTLGNVWTIGAIQSIPGSIKFSGSAGQVNAASGAVELVSGGTPNGAVAWRNNGSTGDILLVPNTSDVLTLQVAAGNQHPLRPIEQGSCTMAAGTTCTFTIGASFSSTPLTLVSIDAASTPPATAISVKCSAAGTTVTITAGASNSLTWDCSLIGNPN